MSKRLSPLLSDRRGYVMLVALLLMGIIGIIGASTLSAAGIDHRIAHHNQKYMMLITTSHAGADHARLKLTGWLTKSEGDNQFDGIGFDQNLGVYWVDAIFEKCGNPPPGYSTEQGNQGFHSDYWAMWAYARQVDGSGTNQNQTITTSVATHRKLESGPCKFR